MSDLSDFVVVVVVVTQSLHLRRWVFTMPRRCIYVYISVLSVRTKVQHWYRVRVRLRLRVGLRVGLRVRVSVRFRI